MKKLLVLLLVTVFVFTLSACGWGMGSGEYSADDGKVSDSENSENGGSGNNASGDDSNNIVSDIMGSDDNASSGAGSAGDETNNGSSDNKFSDKNNSKNQDSINQNSNTSKPSSSENVLISKNEALKIALARAGVSEDNARDIEIELDKERGATVWEIDFDADGTEYSFDVNAKTGTITEREIDY